MNKLELMNSFYYGDYHLKFIAKHLVKKEGLYYWFYKIANGKGYMVIVFKILYKNEVSLDNIYAEFIFSTLKGLNDFCMSAFNEKVTDTFFSFELKRIKDGVYSFVGTNPLEDEFFLDLIDIDRMDVPQRKPIDEFEAKDFKDFGGKIHLDESIKEVMLYKGKDFNGSVDVSIVDDALCITVS